MPIGGGIAEMQSVGAAAAADSVLVCLGLFHA